MKLEFSLWLKQNEVSTSTGSIAGFQRPVSGMIRRDWLGPWGVEDPFFKKKKKRTLLGENAVKIPIPSIKQQTPTSCGSAVTQSICRHFGVGPKSQKEYADALDTDKGGTAPEDIVKFLRKLGLKAEAIEKMSVDKLIDNIEKGSPVICAVQAHATKVRYEKGTAGHYVVAIGHDDGKVHFSDPMTGGMAFLPTKEFVERWHDTDKHGNEYRRLGIVVSAKEVKAKKLN
jgi:predicted double-glycine peptidase